MSDMGLSPQERALSPGVRRLALRGWSTDAISRALGIRRKVVSRILRSGAAASAGLPNPVTGGKAARVRGRIVSGEPPEAISSAEGLDLAAVVDYLARITRCDGVGLRKSPRGRARPLRDRSAPKPRPREPVEWSTLRGKDWRDDDGPDGASSAQICAEMPPAEAPCPPPMTMPPAIAEDWGSPHATSVPGGRLIDDDLVDDIDPQPPSCPPPSCPPPRPHRWRSPGRAGRLDPRYRDDD